MSLYSTRLAAALTSAALALGTLPASPATAQPNAAAAPVPGRADYANLIQRAPTILTATITRAREIDRDQAPGLAPGFRRLLVRAEVDGVIAARSAVPGTISYLVDVPETARGRAPKLQGKRVQLFLGREQGPGEFALAHRYGQQPWSAEREEIVRRLVREQADPKVRAMRPRAITSAFHVEGSLPGESESQIFVDTEAGTPISLVVLNRPGERPRFAVATGDIIDSAAEAPTPGSLTALLLACGLPQALPEDVTVSGDHEALARDYALVRTSLGICDRNF